MPGERLVKDHAEAVEIGAWPDRPARQLLRSHRGQRAHDGADLREPLGRLGEASRDPEVDEPRAAVGTQEHVPGLHVAVHEPALMGVVEGVGHVRGDPRGVGLTQRPVTSDAGRERLAVHELHDDRR